VTKMEREHIFQFVRLSSHPSVTYDDIDANTVPLRLSSHRGKACWVVEARRGRGDVHGDAAAGRVSGVGCRVSGVGCGEQERWQAGFRVCLGFRV